MASPTRKSPSRVLRLPWPPSVNSYYRSFRGRQILSKKAREYRSAVCLMILGQEEFVEAPFKAPSRLKVTFEVYPPDRRIRDLSNLPKGMEDALTHAQVWDDDKQIDDLRIVRRECLGRPGHVEVTIEEV